MALNKFTQIGNSGFGTDTSINTTGIVTAASFSGDGSALTGVTAVGSGVVVREEGSNVGTAQTINFIGTGVTATLSGGIANIEIATSGGGGGGGLSNVVEDTTPQLGGNLDLNSKNITGTGDISITGVVTATTFVGALTGDASGNAATATTLQNARTIGGVSFDGSANINLPGVNAAGNQDTSGTASVATNVTVANEASDTECFVMFGVNATGNNAPKSSSSLKYNSSSGGLTAGSFIGDGSGLTGITASGSGVIVRDGGSLVGTAGTIDFGTNVSVSPISAGVVTVTASAGSIPGISTSGTTQFNNLAVAGIGTFTSGLTVPSTGTVTVGPNFTLSSNSNGSLVELRNSGGNSSDALRYRAQTHQFMDQAATTTRMSINSDSSINLNHSNIPVLKTIGAGVTIGTTGYPATLFTNQFSVSGVSTFTGTAFLDQLRVSGISTLNSIYIGDADEIRFGAGAGNNINPTGDFKIRHDNINAFNMLYDDITGHRARFQSQIGGVTNNAFEFRRASNTLAMMRESEIILYSGGSAKFQTAATGAVVTGILTATTFSGSGASLTTLNASELDSGTIPDARFPSTLPAVSGANLTNLPAPTPADTDIQATFDVSSNGSSAYRFTGPGNSGSDDNPDLYLVRGQRYRFINGTGSSHPFEIRVSNGGSAYTDGITGSTSGTQDFNVQHDAPARLYYQCTIHSGMVGTIYIVGGDQFIPDGEKLSLGTDADLEIEHTGSGSFIRTSASSNGDLAIESRGTNHDLYLTAADDIYIRPQGGEDGIKVHGNGSVELFYDSSLRFQTNSDAVTMRGGGAHRCEGNFRPWSANTYDLGTSGDRWNKVYTNGVLFNGDTSANNTLDDYEEGTFTPTVSVEGQSNATTDKNYGRYVKVGKMVTVWCYIQLNGTPSGRGVNNAWQHGGLPFTKVNTAGGFDIPGSMLYWTIDSSANLNGTAPYSLVPRLFNNSNGGRIRAHDSSNNQYGQNASYLLKDNTEYTYTFTYEVA